MCIQDVVYTILFSWGLGYYLQLRSYWEDSVFSVNGRVRCQITFSELMVSFRVGAHLRLPVPGTIIQVIHYFGVVFIIQDMYVMCLRHYFLIETYIFSLYVSEIGCLFKGLNNLDQIYKMLAVDAMCVY